MPINYVFNEKEFLEHIFSFKKEDGIRNKIYNLTFASGCTQIFFHYIIKYMIYVLNINPISVEKYIKEYSIIFLYSYIMEEKQQKEIKESIDISSLRVRAFDEILDNGITIEGLDSVKNVNHSLFERLYFFEDVETFRKASITFESIFTNSKKHKIANSINLLKKIYNFFKQNKLEIKEAGKNYAYFDEMIAETLLDDKLLDINLVIEDKYRDNYLQNFVKNNSKANHDDAHNLLFSSMIIGAINNNNFDLSKSVSLLESGDIKVYCLNKDLNVKSKNEESHLQFVNKDLFIDKSLIVPFKFKMNKVRYELNKKELKKLS